MAGCQRLRVAQKLNIESVPVRVLDVSDALAINEVIIGSNVARQKTVEQRTKEYRELKRIEAVKAAARKGKRPDLKANLPSGEAGASRDLAATKVGWSGGTAEKASKVLTAIDDRAEAGENMTVVEEVRRTLNSGSVDGAYQRVVQLGWIEGKPTDKAKRSGDPQRRIQTTYEQATAAAEKLAEIVRGDDIVGFTPEHLQVFRQALEPVMKWLGGHSPLQPAAEQAA